MSVQDIMRAYAKSTAQHPVRAYFQLAPHNSTGSPQWRNWRNRVTTRTQIERTQTYGRHNTTHALNASVHTSWELSVLKPHAGTGHAAHESLVYLSSLYKSSNSPTTICSILKEAAYISKQLGARTNPPHTALPTHTDRHMSHIVSEYLTANHTADLWFSVAHSALYRCTMQMHNADARMHRPTKRAMA